MPRTAKPPISAWIVRERKRLGLKPHDLAQRLSAMGLPVADGTPRTWEAGRSPSADNIEGLERIFGSAAPTEMAGGADSTLTAGLSALVEQISELVEELRASRQERADLLERVEALETAAMLRGPAGGGTAATRPAPAGRGE